ncbi:hypothetical protein CDAR_419391 [Caerostris darwini]|uniref:Uncharacterized protein n=1 Tax=Caerostris darwini TaxID=1538125 RepID=A0AAV4U395_9ARAC|nr:hypothetical protein CDAR_419391 [Caerostris darwini]
MEYVDCSAGSCVWQGERFDLISPYDEISPPNVMGNLFYVKSVETFIQSTTSYLRSINMHRIPTERANIVYFNCKIGFRLSGCGENSVGPDK